MTTVETTTCPGSGRSPSLMRRGPGIHPRGDCPQCGVAVELLTHPDGGAGPVVDDHPAVKL